MRRSLPRIGRGINVLLAGMMAAGSAIAFGAAQPASAATSGSRAAASGSIVYLKGGRVWIAHADGTHTRKFTLHAFNWSSPSEANNGTIVVAGGHSDSSEIYRFRPDGNQIGGPIPTWATFSSPSCPTFPPLSVEVSPDTTKIAYGIWECGSGSYTALWTPATSTKLNFPHQHVGQMDFYEPHWVSNTTFLVSHAGPTVTDSQARWYTHGVTQADDVGYKGWNEPAMTGTGAQGVIDRTGDKLAVFEDDAADWLNGKPRNVRLWLYGTTGPKIPTNWTKRCVIKLPAAQISKPLFLHPSFSPDGKRLIWGDNRGVEEASVANPGKCSSYRPHLLIRGGSEPFFSAGTERSPAAHPHQPG
jgi:hypothetical protein